MTLEQLRIFVAVAAREHMTAAARDLNLTQSAISAAIAALENRYDARLFDRIGRGIVLTDAGRAFLGEAKAVLARARSAEATLADFAGLRRGAVALGASQTAGNYWLPQLVSRFVAAYPGIAVSLAIDNTRSIARMTHDGDIDIGYVEGDAPEAALLVERVADDEMLLVAAPDHPWVARPPRAMADFAAARWVFREQGSGTRAAAEAALATLGLPAPEIRIALEFPSNEAVRGAVEAGAGVAVLSRLVAMRAIRAGLLGVVDVALPTRSFHSLRHKDRFLTTAMRAFMALVAEESGPGVAGTANQIP